MLERNTDLVCTTCRWRAGHAPDCPRKDEPWPMIEVPHRIPLDLGSVTIGLYEQPDGSMKIGP